MFKNRRTTTTDYLLKPSLCAPIVDVIVKTEKLKKKKKSELLTTAIGLHFSRKEKRSLLLFNAINFNSFPNMTQYF